MSGVITGSGTRVNIQRESSYKTLDGSASAYVPGANGRLQTAQAANQITRITNFGSATAVALEESNFDGAWNLTFALEVPWWLELFFGSPNTTDNSDGSYTHTYSGADSRNTAHIIEGYETSTNAERELKGAVATRASFEPAVDEDGVTQVTLEGFHAVEDTNTSVTLTTQDTIDDEVLDYADAELKRDGTAESVVQSSTLELAYERVEPVREFGSRFATDYLTGLFTPSLDYRKIKQDANTIQDVYGSSGATTVNEDVDNTVSTEVNWDNGISAGSGINKCVCSLSTTLPNSYDEEGVGDPSAAIVEVLNRTVTDVTVDWTNETSSPP